MNTDSSRIQGITISNYFTLLAAGCLWLSRLNLFLSDVIVAVPGYDEVTVDISYGGAFYAFVRAERFGLDINKSKTRDLVDAATAVTNSVKSQVKICSSPTVNLQFNGHSMFTTMS